MARRYADALIGVAIATLATSLIGPWIGPSISLLFFPAVVFIAMRGGLGPALFATILSTCSLAFFFVTPYYSFDLGLDDAIRLLVFGAVAFVTASISSARTRAEVAQQHALQELRGALNTLRKVSGWPVFVDASLAGGARKLLDHAASVVECACVVCVWEAEDEPWVYLAVSSPGPEGVTKYPPNQLGPLLPAGLADDAFVSESEAGAGTLVLLGERGTVTELRGLTIHRDIASHFSGRGIASAPFEVERLSGRIFFSGLHDVSAEIIPLAEVVAREVGNSLERLHLHERLQQIAIREDRIRVARDLHDGVLQSLTGIRLQLQSLADDLSAPPGMRDNLLAVERALAIEQRELRLFIEDLKPEVSRPRPESAIVEGLEELRTRLADEWKTPIVVRVTPAGRSLPAADGQTIRLLVREAIVNALKHAHPSRVSVDVDSPDPRTLRIVVGNDGRGFAFRGRLEHDELVALNAGPVSLRERVMSLGGSLAIESAPGGARVELTLPLIEGPAPDSTSMDQSRAGSVRLQPGRGESG